VVAEGLELGNGPPDSHPSWRPQAMRVLSEIDSGAPCYPAFPLVVRLRKWPRDGVNHTASESSMDCVEGDPPGMDPTQDGSSVSANRAGTASPK